MVQLCYINYSSFSLWFNAKLHTHIYLTISHVWIIVSLWALRPFCMSRISPTSPPCLRLFPSPTHYPWAYCMLSIRITCQAHMLIYSWEPYTFMHVYGNLSCISLFVNTILLGLFFQDYFCRKILCDAHLCGLQKHVPFPYSNCEKGGACPIPCEKGTDTAY